MIFLQAVAANVVKWLLVKLGAYLNDKIKIGMAKFWLWLKLRKARNEDHEKMQTIREKIEKAETTQEINDALNELRNHY